MSRVIRSVVDSGNISGKSYMICIVQHPGQDPGLNEHLYSHVSQRLIVRKWTL